MKPVVEDRCTWEGIWAHIRCVTLLNQKLCPRMLNAHALRMSRFLVREARALGLQVIDRCNLTVLLEPGQADLVDFLAANRVWRAVS